LCRAVIDPSVVQLLAGHSQPPPTQHQPFTFSPTYGNQMPAVNVSHFCIRTYFDSIE
jgi:hypothetical protein